MAFANLASAKEAKKDEFYTDIKDIQSELSHYSDKFKDKVVFCNCDDPFESNFVKYLKDHHDGSILNEDGTETVMHVIDVATLDKKYKEFSK